MPVSDTPTLLCLSGSLRKASLNTLLLAEAARVFGPAEVVFGDLRMPLYDGDLESAEGIPTPAKVLREQIASADAVVISTPEYNSGIPGVLKNALDWVSRMPPMAFTGKPVAIVSAAAGQSGGARAQFGLRLALVPFGAQVLPAPDVLISGAHKAFDEDGQLKNPDSIKFLTGLMERLRAQIV